MSGVSALSAARGSIVSALSAPNSGNSGSLDSVRVEVGGGNAVIDSVWALRTSWYEGEVRPNLTDWWWRQLDSFCVDSNDPRIINLLERMRDNCLPDATAVSLPGGDRPGERRQRHRRSDPLERAALAGRGSGGSQQQPPDRHDPHAAHSVVRGREWPGVGDGASNWRLPSISFHLRRVAALHQRRTELREQQTGQESR